MHSSALPLTVSAPPSRTPSQLLPLLAVLLFAAFGATAPAAAAAPPSTYRATAPSTWAGIDALHRSLPHPSLTPPLRLNRTAGIFYFLWLGRNWPGPYDNSALLAAAGNDRHKVKYGPLAAYHWGQPQLGYYLSEDQWVMRKHASMLSDAGVDFVCFDVTNGLTYDDTWGALLDVWADMRAHGSRTPQVTFLFWTDVPHLVQHLHDVLYSKRLHEDLWFRCHTRTLTCTLTSPSSDASTPLFSWCSCRHSSFALCSALRVRLRLTAAVSVNCSRLLTPRLHQL